jgi:hypothetical protein
MTWSCDDELLRCTPVPGVDGARTIHWLRRGTRKNQGAQAVLLDPKVELGWPWFVLETMEVDLVSGGVFWSSKGKGTGGVFTGESYGMQSKDSSNQILPFWSFIRRFCLDLQKGKILVWFLIQDKSSSLDLLLQFPVQKSPWWPWPAVWRSQPFRRGATTAWSGMTCTVSSTRGQVAG